MTKSPVRHKLYRVLLTESQQLGWTQERYCRVETAAALAIKIASDCIKLQN